MSDVKRRGSRVLFACVVGGIAIMLGLMLYARVLAPYFQARRIVQDRLIQGRPIVKAAYEYRRLHGHWPDAIQDLVPEHLPELPAVEGNWIYMTSASEPPVLSTDAGRGRRLIYGFPSRTASLFPSGVDHGWIIDGRDGEAFIATD